MLDCEHRSLFVDILVESLTIVLDSHRFPVLFALMHSPRTPMRHDSLYVKDFKLRFRTQNQSTRFVAFEANMIRGMNQFPI